MKCSQYLHAQIQGSEIMLLPGAGHMMMIEQLQTTNSAIRAFLERLDQEAPR